LALALACTAPGIGCGGSHQGRSERPQTDTAEVQPEDAKVADANLADEVDDAGIEDAAK
jgi:hypothetical protein